MSNSTIVILAVYTCHSPRAQACACVVRWKEVYEPHLKYEGDKDSPTASSKAKLGVPSAPTTLEINAAIDDYLVDDDCRSITDEYLLSAVPTAWDTMEGSKKDHIRCYL